MKIACQSCQAKYTIADEKVLGKVVKIRCKKCGATIVVNGQDPGDAGAGVADEAPTDMGGGAGELGQGDAAEGWTVNVADDDQRTLTTHQVVAEFAKGTINDETYCWRDGMGDWLPLREVEELASACGLNGAGGFARQAPSSVRPAAVGSGGGVFGVQAAAAPASSQRGAAATAATARRAGGRAPAADLFGAAAEAGGENDVMTSAPQNPNAAMEGDGKMTGQRNENSVLFSLNALTATPAKKDETTAQGDGSGLIDIRALSSSMSSASGPKKTNHADDIMNLGGGGAFSAALAAPVLTAPPLNSMDGSGGVEGSQGNKKLLIIAMAIGAVAIVAMFGMYLAMKPSKPDLATAPTAESSTAATPAGPTPSATGTTPPAAVAANDPGAAATASDPVKATAPNVGAPKRNTSSGGQSAPPPPAMPKIDTPPAPPSAPKSLEQMMGGAVGGGKAAAPAAPAGGSTDPFDRGAAAGALGAVDVSGCKKGDGPTGPGHVSITFGPSGAVQTAVVDQPPYAGTAVGGCVAGKFRGARVPPFAGGATKVGKSFVIN